MQKEIKGLSNIKTANTGDIILFERNSSTYEGKVFNVRINSVLVEISNTDAQTLGYEQPNTVVRHGNYRVV